MIIELPLFSDSSRRNQANARPIRMGFFHFSNNNLSIRRQCARDVGMYDLKATKSEDVDLCFRVAMSPKWIAWREDNAVVRHKGRRTLWGLITQMWGWGLYVGYPYAKTGIRGVFLYWLNGRNHTLVGRFETDRFPILVCAFPTDFYFVNAFTILLVLAACFGQWWLTLIAIAGLAWATPRYLADIRKVTMLPSAKVKLAIVHYLTNVAFTAAAFLGALRHRIILIPSSVFRPDDSRQP
jgi:hypothetical protein